MMGNYHTDQADKDDWIECLRAELAAAAARESAKAWERIAEDQLVGLRTQAAELARLRAELADTKDDYMRRHKDAVDLFERNLALNNKLDHLRAEHDNALQEHCGRLRANAYLRSELAATRQEAEKMWEALDRIYEALTVNCMTRTAEAWNADACARALEIARAALQGAGRDS